MRLPKKFIDRVASGLKPYQQIAASHRTRDVSEADTVTVVKDILADVLGYNKYTELTSEQKIRGTFCDLAIKIDDKIRVLVEVKAAAIDLNDSHVRQAVNYGANQGIEWVALTNAVEWRLYKVRFEQPIDHEEIARFCLLDVSHKNDDDLQKLFLLAREGMAADAISSFYQQAQLLNKYTVAQLLLSEGIIKQLRRDLRKLFPDVAVDTTQISDLITNDILKREVLEGDRVKETQVRIRKALQKIAREGATQARSEASNLSDTVIDTSSEEAA